MYEKRHPIFLLVAPAMPLAPPEQLSNNEFAEVLETLEHLLKHLPTQQPSPNDTQSRY